MTPDQLTGPRASATVYAAAPYRRSATGVGMRHIGALGLMVVTGLVAGCINVSAPDDPIVIELNINIRQEVIYRLAEDAASTIDDNADIF